MEKVQRKLWILKVENGRKSRTEQAHIDKDMCVILTCDSKLKFSFPSSIKWKNN